MLGVSDAASVVGVVGVVVGGSVVGVVVGGSVVGDGVVVTALIVAGELADVVDISAGALKTIDGMTVGFDEAPGLAHAASAAHIVAAEAAAFHALLMIASPLGGC